MKKNFLKTGMTVVFLSTLTVIFITGFVTLPNVFCMEYPAVQEDKPEVVSVCPKTKMGKNCLTCHVVPDFKLKEAKPDRTLDYPRLNMSIVGNICFVFIEDINSDKILKILQYLDWHPDVTRIVLEIHSPGGGVMEAWRMIGMLEEVKGRYKIVTRVYGMAASAGFMLFCVGDERIASPTAELMVHEVWSLKIFSVETPSDSEDEARILRHFQDNISSWIAKRSTLDKESLDFLIKKKDYWMTGEEAHRLGFVTRLTIK